MDARKILKKVEAKEVKVRFTASVDPSVLASFKEVCGDRSISAVIEELMKEFVESAKKVGK